MRRWHLYVFLAAGVAAVSFSAIFIRLAHAPALAMAFWRNLIATALLAPIAFARHREDFSRLSRPEVVIAVLMKNVGTVWVTVTLSWFGGRGVTVTSELGKPLRWASS